MTPAARLLFVFFVACLTVLILWGGHDPMTLMAGAVAAVCAVACLGWRKP